MLITFLDYSVEIYNKLSDFYEGSIIPGTLEK